MSISWEREIESLHNHIGKYLNRDAEKPTPFPDGLNLCSRNSEELFPYGSFCEILEWQRMAAESKRNWVLIMKKCRDRNMKQNLHEEKKRTKYFQDMDQHLRNKGIDPFKHLDQGSYFINNQDVQRILKEMTGFTLPKTPLLTEFKFPQQFAPNVRVISDLDLSNVEFRNNPAIPCLRCRPCHKQSPPLSPQFSSPEVTAVSNDPNANALANALLDDILGSSDETFTDNFSPVSSPHDQQPRAALPLPPQISPAQKHMKSSLSPVQSHDFLRGDSSPEPPKPVKPCIIPTHFSQSSNTSKATKQIPSKCISKGKQSLKNIPSKSRHVTIPKKCESTKVKKESPMPSKLYPIKHSSPVKKVKSVSYHLVDKVPFNRHELILSDSEMMPANGTYYFTDGLWRLENRKAKLVVEICRTDQGWCIIGISRNKRRELFRSSESSKFPPKEDWRCVYKEGAKGERVLCIRFPNLEDRKKEPKKGRIRRADAFEESFPGRSKSSDESDSDESSSSDDSVVIPVRKRKLSLSLSLSLKSSKPTQRKNSWTNHDVVYSDDESLIIKRRKRLQSSTTRAPSQTRKPSASTKLSGKRMIPQPTREAKRLKKEPSSTQEIFDKAKHMKRQASLETDVYEKLRKFMISGMHFIDFAVISRKSGVSTEKADDMLLQTARFFDQTFISSMPKDRRAQERIPKKAKLLFSLCLDCEAILVRELVRMHSDKLFRMGEALKQMPSELLAQRSPGSSIGSNPPESNYSVYSGDSLHSSHISKGDQLNYYVNMCQNMIQAQKKQQKAWDIRKELGLKIDLPTTDGMRADDLQAYINRILDESGLL